MPPPCGRQVEIPLEAAYEIRAHHLIVIVSGCPNPHQKEWRSFRQGPGYTLYRHVPYRNGVPFEDED
jgi:hypothetical protein